MSRLPKNAVTEFKQIFIENLEKWIDIPIWNEEDLLTMIESFDLTDMEIDEYRARLVRDLVSVKEPNEAAVHEIYEILIRENPMLKPINVYNVQAVKSEPEVTDEEKKKIMMAFASRGTMGPKIKIIEGGLNA